MKALMILFLSGITVFVSCSKDKLPATGAGSANASSASSSAKPEDNPNGGGGDHIAASAVPAVVGAAFAKLYPDAAQIQ
jgi:hypothetical protein